MHIHQPPQNKGLIRQPSLCAWLDLTRSGLDKLRKNDHTFPQPIKNNKTRQAAAYYVVAEVEAWLASRIDARNKAFASANNSKDDDGDAK
ncbi:MAG: transcriptional regulator [Pseudomonadota bacterium]